MKKAFKRKEKSTCLNTVLCQFLLTYRTTPHCTTKRTPAELMGRQLRTRLDLLHPSAADRIQKQGSKGESSRGFYVGDTVLVRDYRTGSRKGIWIKGKILEELSPVTYKVMVENDIKWKRHIDQLRIFKNEVDQLISSEDSLVPERGIYVPGTSGDYT